MALADRSTTPTPHGPRCGIAKRLAKLPADDKATLLAWLADDEVEGTVIARNLTDEGVRTSEHMVRHHRNGQCSCGTV